MYFDPGSMIRDARLDAGLTQAQLAQRSGTSQATLSAYESGSKIPSAITLARILAAAGRRMTTIPVPRPVMTPGRAELEQRGRILAQVVDLAERFPGSHASTLRYPRLRELVSEAQ